MHSALKHDGGRTFMKKLIVLFVALAVATGAFAADFSFSWDTDIGWASNFDDTYAAEYSELELAVAADIDDYNSFAFEMEPATKTVTTTVTRTDTGSDTPATSLDDTFAGSGTIANVLQMNKFTITTDLGSYFGLSGVSVEWVNGITDPGDEEYADFTNVGFETNGLALTLTKGRFDRC